MCNLKKNTLKKEASIVEKPVFLQESTDLLARPCHTVTPHFVYIELGVLYKNSWLFKIFLNVSAEVFVRSGKTACSLHITQKERENGELSFQKSLCFLS